MDDNTKNNVKIKIESNTKDCLLDSNDEDTISLREKHGEPDQNMDKKTVPKRKIIPHDKSSKKRRKRIVVQEYSSSSDEDEYSLTVSNLPNDWTYVQIKNYIDKECGPVDEIEMLKQGDFVNCAIRLTFQSLKKCEEIMKNLLDKEVEGKQLELQMTGTHHNEEPQKSKSKVESCSDTNANPTTVTPPIANEDTWDGNPKDLYGLKPQFLKSLGIKPPLDKWVHVTNFRCDKSELRDVMELAGHVLMCSVNTMARKYAKVMYSHPLEAVQAISMLDGQLFYGQALKVIMDRNPSNMFVLPKGLPNIGLGLGIQGRPIRNITKQYSKYLKKHSSLINPILFNEVDAEVEFLNNAEMKELDDKINKQIKELKDSTKKDKRLFSVKNFEELDSYETNDTKNKSSDTKLKPSSLGSNSPDLTLSPNPNIRITDTQIAPRHIGPQNFQSLGNSLPVRLSHKPAQNIPQPLIPSPTITQNVPLPGSGFRLAPFNPPPPGQFRPPQGPYGPMPGPNFAPQPMPGPFGAGPVPRPQAPMNNVGPMMRPNMPIPGPVRPQGNATVHFANLPPTTTFPLLCEKLSLCGQVMSVQLTTPGCAVATFAHRSHAERCLQTYNGMNVDGYLLGVNVM